MSWSDPEVDVVDNAIQKSDRKIDEKVIDMIVSKLTSEEEEVAANTSYKYFKACRNFLSTKNSDSIDDKLLHEIEKEKDTLRVKAIRRMAKRHLIAEKMDSEKAILKMKATVKFRKEMKVDDFRVCFEDKNNHEYDDLRKTLLVNSGVVDNDSPRPNMYVPAYDLNGTACIFVDVGILPAKFDGGWLKWHLYLAERAIASSERKSDEEKMCIFFNYNNFSSSRVPPLKIAKEVVCAFRDHYPERMDAVFMIDTPFLFRSFWNLIKMFVDPVTKSKMVFVTGDDQKEKMLTNNISADYALPFMCPTNVQAGLNYLEDIEDFFYNTPFDYVYGEKQDT